MAKETCTSDLNRTKTVETKIKTLEALAKEVKEKFGVGVWFAEVLGRRWSYIAGERSEELFFPPKKVQLCNNLGVVIECDDREEIIEEIIRFIVSHLREC